MSIEFEGTEDPLFRGVPLRHRVQLTVLGVPVHFASNAASVIAVAVSAFRTVSYAAASPTEVEPVDVTIIVQPGTEGGAEHARLYYRILEGRRVLFASPGSVGIADPERREAVAFVTPDLAGDREHFRYAVLQAMVLALITPLDRQPFHAAAIVRGGTALLLAGPSGVGKSSLAYAALEADRHIGVLAEDTVFLQSFPRLRIWGLPGHIHLPPDLGTWFPELQAMQPSMLVNRKAKLALDLGTPGGLTGIPVVERARVCFLVRGQGRPGLRRLSPEDVLARLESTRREDGFDLFADTIRVPLELLTKQGGWLLELSEDPREAVPFLEQMLEDAAIPAA